MSGRKTLACLFIVITTIAIAQNRKLDSLARILSREGKSTKQIDSLNRLLHGPLSDTARSRILFRLCELCDIKDNLKYTRPLIALCEKIIDSKVDTTARRTAYLRMAFAYRCERSYYLDIARDSERARETSARELNVMLKLGDMEAISRSFGESADSHFRAGEILNQVTTLENGLNIMERENYLPGVSFMNSQLARAFAMIGDTEQALRYLTAVEVTERKLNDSTRLRDRFLRPGLTYSYMKRYDKAIELLKLSLPHFKKDLYQTGELYYHIAKTYQQNNELDSAAKYFGLCLSVTSEMNDAKRMFMAIIGLGNVYSLQGKHKEALEKHTYTLKLAQQVNNEGGIRLASDALATSYFHAGNYRAAKEHVGTLLRLNEQYGALIDKISGEELAYRIDSAYGNHASALQHYKTYISFLEKLHNDEAQKLVARAKFTADLEKQRLEAKTEQERRDLANIAEKRKQKTIIYGTGSGMVILLLFAALIFRSNRQKQKANLELSSKNAIIELQKKVVEEKHKEITDSINYAERIQKSFLAPKDLLDGNLRDYFVFFRPKDVVSGDFYWAEMLPGNRLALATADSTGHGVPGAIMSLLNITSLERSIEKHNEPHEILNETRTNIIARLKKDGSSEGGKDGMDCSLIVFNKDRTELHIAAANNDVWIIRAGELIEISPDKMPVGKHDRDQNAFSLKIFQLQEGDAIYTFTDGFPDQFGGTNGKKYMRKNLKKLLLQNEGLKMREQKLMIEEEFISWSSGHEQVDDVTIIGIRV